MVAVIIMAAEANNDGNSIKWLFVVVPLISMTQVSLHLLFLLELI